MGGATSIVHFLARYAPEVRLTGLCDEREERLFLRALERAGRDDIACFVCHADLEDELIRALGPEAVQAVIDAARETASWQRMRKQPAQLGRPIEHQLRRFMGTRSGRKERYATLLVAALDVDAVPRPLVDALAHALAA